MRRLHRAAALRAGWLGVWLALLPACRMDAGGDSNGALGSAQETCSFVDTRLVTPAGDRAGSIEISNTDDTLRFEILVGPGRSFSAAHIYASVDPVPTDSAGDANPNDFPFVFEELSSRISAVYQVPLSEVGSACGETLYVAVHLRAGSDSLWAEGPFVFTGPNGGYWMYYDLCCENPGGEDAGGGSPDAGSEDAGGGGPDVGGEDAGGGTPDAGGEDAGNADAGGEDQGGEDQGGEDQGGEDQGGDSGAEEDGCTLTQGYWKNHHAYASNESQQIPWPISEDTVLCGERWLDVLWTPPRGEAWVILAHQYIAAQLNAASGASTDALGSALEEGGLLLEESCAGLEDGEREHALAIASLLDDYNNGDIGPGHCDDGDPDNDDDGEGGDDPCGDGDDHDDDDHDDDDHDDDDHDDDDHDDDHHHHDDDD